MNGGSEIWLIYEDPKKSDGGRCPPYETLQSGSEQEFAPTNATCRKVFCLEITLKLPTRLESRAVESWGSQGKTSNYNGCLMVVECTINVGFHCNFGAFGE